MIAFNRLSLFLFFKGNQMIDVSNSQAIGPVPAALVEGILAGDKDSVEGLFELYTRGLTFYFARKFGCQDAGDLVTETLMLVWEAIRAGSIREPERLAGFVMTIARRISYRVIEVRTQARQSESYIDHELAICNGLRTTAESPEDALFRAQQQIVMLKVLRGISRRDREVLERFYLLGQSPEQIQAETGMTETQFRLTKSRAKSRFGELGRKLLNQSKGRGLAQRADGMNGGIACA